MWVNPLVDLVDGWKDITGAVAALTEGEKP